MADINEVYNGGLAQLLYKIKILYEYVLAAGINHKFTDELKACVELTFDKNIVSVGGENQIGWVLKDSCKALDGRETVVTRVRDCLDRAYKACHTADGRLLPYEKYESFMEVCRGWGSLMHDRRMMNWYQETLDEYTTGGRKQAAEPTNAGTKTGGAERMQELLAKLKKLLEEYA